MQTAFLPDQPVWFKSSYSGSQGDCVEVAHIPSHFRTSTYSTAADNCVEVADTTDFGAIRDTKHRDLGALVFPSSEWRAFLSAVRDGDL